MLFSVWPTFTRPWADLAAFAAHMDSGDWHCLWYADHYMMNTESADRSDVGGLEVWAVMGALAVHTKRVRIGTLVSPTTMHHPAVLANRAATVDRISDGRLTLGLGAGWQINEHEAYGVDLLEAKQRVDRFEEFIQVVRLLMSEARADFVGEHFTLADAPMEPKPVQNPLPLLVGTGGPRMTRLAARWAHQWNVWGTPERVAPLAAAMDRACELEGRPAEGQHRSVQALVFMINDAADAAKIRYRAPADRSLIGTTSYLVEQIGRYRDSGIDEFILPDFTLGSELQERIDAYDRFRSEVVAQLS
jgi:alkanesulfonate monooxygenase SsuD/methylene tetrahydromethanopterin reductase-like flavin-dependent oxidoreductase (luciferase family)